MPGAANLLETLERWGIRRFQDLAALPPLGIAERLGPEGLRLRELARGEAGAQAGRRSKTRCVSKTNSSWNTRWNCWSRWRSCWRG